MSTAASSRTVSSEHSRSRLSTADPPKKAGEPIGDGKCDHGPISPHSVSSVEQDPSSPKVAFVERLVNENQTQLKNNPSDSTPAAMVKGQQKVSDLSRRKSQFYGEVFAYREPNVSARNKIHQFSVITVEVKTNVIINDEYVFLTDLSQHLSQRYHKPVSSIFVTLSHSACLLFAGTFDSAYILTVTALPSQIQAATNKRNAALIQNFMADSLGVSPDRGVVRFVGIAEEFLATNGTTVLSEIENFKKTPGEDSRTESSRLSTIRGRGRRASRPQGITFAEETGAKDAANSPSPPLKSARLPSFSPERNHLDIQAEKVQKMGRRRSIMALFGK